MTPFLMFIFGICMVVAAATDYDFKRNVRKTFIGRLPGAQIFTVIGTFLMFVGIVQGMMAVV